jgi:hypothetical protein
MLEGYLHPMVARLSAMQSVFNLFIDKLPDGLKSIFTRVA